MIPSLGRPQEGAREEPAEAVHRAGVVLVVDESRPVRAKLVEILQKMGTPAEDILQAASAEEALLAFREKRPAIVFAELVGVHPEDGLEVVHEMLDHDPTARIVIVTAEPRESAEVRASLRAGVFAVVDKPLRYEKIRAVLADLEAEEGGIERFR